LSTEESIIKFVCTSKCKLIPRALSQQLFNVISTMMTTFNNVAGLHWHRVIQHQAWFVLVWLATTEGSRCCTFADLAVLHWCTLTGIYPIRNRNSSWYYLISYAQDIHISIFLQIVDFFCWLPSDTILCRLLSRCFWHLIILRRSCASIPRIMDWSVQYDTIPYVVW
jgi:hypothetical protein